MALNITFRKTADFDPKNVLMDIFERSETNRINDLNGLLRTLGATSNITLCPIVKNLSLISPPKSNDPLLVKANEKLKQFF